MKHIITLVAGLLCGQLQAQIGTPAARTVVGINEDWKFIKESTLLSTPESQSKAVWQSVNLPHTWNVADVMDDEPGYYRGKGFYIKNVSIDPAWKNKKVNLYVEGANQEADVLVNGKLAGKHIGGYTGFNIAISQYLQYDENTNSNRIEIHVNNRHNENIPPLTADFTFYGGLYRDCWLIATNNIHFTVADNGSSGVYITTPKVNAEAATVHLASTISNETAKPQKLKVITSIRDKAGNFVQEITSLVNVKANSEQTFQQDSKPIAKPELWSPEHPYLYTATTIITDAKTGELFDQLSNTVGFRWFSFDADKGFFLNGAPYKLVGSSRHQDYSGLGNAVPDELARKDVQWLKQMGGNFLRIAHYPQDPSILKACDELGILSSVEIPVVNEITETDSFYNNCLNMQVEMIRQNYNHPSIIIWCYMNEVLLRPHFNNDKPRQETYFANIARLARMLDSTTRKEDPTRYTMLVNHGDFNRYRDVGLTAIPMLVGWNLYSGWYGGALTDFPAFLDRHHKELPDKPLLVTEYGADADPRIHSLHPVRFDKSIEYTTAFHQYYLTEMLKRPFVAGAMLWNLADFNSEGREETMPHINNKGLLRWDRTPKDPYYYYQAALRKDPILKILGGDYVNRSGIADSNANSCRQPVQVATNLDSVTLFINGKSLGARRSNNGLVEWNVPFANGGNILQVQAQKNGQLISDQLSVDFHMLADKVNDPMLPFTQINVLLGADRYYVDEQRKQTWIPDRPYRQGGWGHVGGNPFRISNNNRLPYGTDKNMVATEDDPIYQTQQIGISEYRLDVLPGNYEITLHFAELLGGTVKGLPYNLSAELRKEDEVQRSFNVSINNIRVLENFDIGRQYGIAKAVAKKFTITVISREGIQIKFDPIKGEPVLNAIQVKKL
ncbi:glycoside hydrolase family 2 TIM barrel-domain containing protein [Paraflavitalea sp. CAU 1676]|uniref:glycoside hydrolase family 2 TIM barrel-domain containing protein n=1 Tax=Paraflavitalea sp. CAU 1676 TaxID=3032598 RepID=UPI0023DBE89F|nr:glycoside hydrolase family 2 TIM barrel-domain containing protein [Paraflavitalea sp. CAU 1676]MDF2187345.1 glycoside hydrolase family 2 TIM barrel-domain containing protein [Paraflavitalea sp. CAU 1676]